MCDYSLHGINNRLAVEGEALFVHRFQTGSKGLASVTDLETSRQQAQFLKDASLWVKLKAWINGGMGMINDSETRSLCAVCIPPGARLMVHDIPPRLQRECGLKEQEEATFVELTAEPFRYRDALRFKNGQEILLQRLNEGLRVEVLRLSLALEKPKIWQTSDLRRNLEQPVY
jgi:hypothetical protein